MLAHLAPSPNGPMWPAQLFHMTRPIVSYGSPNGPIWSAQFFRIARPFVSQEKTIGPVNIGNPGEFTIKQLAELAIKVREFLEFLAPCEEGGTEMAAGGGWVGS